jgi:hypothetical protein
MINNIKFIFLKEIIFNYLNKLFIGGHFLIFRWWWKITDNYDFENINCVITQVTK